MSQYNHRLLPIIKKYYEIVWNHANIYDLIEIFNENIKWEFLALDEDKHLGYSGKDVIEKFYSLWMQSVMRLDTEVLKFSITYLSDNSARAEYEINQKHFDPKLGKYQMYKFMAEEKFKIAEENDRIGIKSIKLTRVYKIPI